MPINKIKEKYLKKKKKERKKDICIRGNVLNEKDGKRGGKGYKNNSLCTF